MKISQKKKKKELRFEEPEHLPAASGGIMKTHAASRTVSIGPHSADVCELVLTLDEDERKIFNRNVEESE